MDTSDPNISFDRHGHCNHCREFFLRQQVSSTSPPTATENLDTLIARIKSDGKSNAYDCIAGISGGLDSTYLLYLAQQWGLRVLALHVDNGWNSDLSVSNITKALRAFSFDLETYVIDWAEFQDLQRSYFNAGVVDIEVLTDQAILGASFRLAQKRGIRHILLGTNQATEHILPHAWNFNKIDSVNLRAIHDRHGTVPLKTYPVCGLRDYLRYTLGAGIRIHSPLNLVPYSKKSVTEELVQRIRWRPYRAKHGESLFTQFYQGYVLPKKFGFDKRRAHLSTLICSGEITRQEALEELNTPPYDKDLEQEHFGYVAKKLGFDHQEFDRILSRVPVSHFAFPTDSRSKLKYWIYPLIRPIRNRLQHMKIHALNRNVSADRVD